MTSIGDGVFYNCRSLTITIESKDSYAHKYALENDINFVFPTRFSDCRAYRYELWRAWDKNLPYAMFIGLNPSTADETKDDRTITTCIRFAKDWGYGSLCMVNLFAYRATKPKDLKSA